MHVCLKQNNTKFDNVVCKPDRKGSPFSNLNLKKFRGWPHSDVELHGSMYVNIPPNSQNSKRHGATQYASPRQEA